MMFLSPLPDESYSAYIDRVTDADASWQTVAAATEVWLDTKPARATYEHNLAAYCSCGWEWVGPSTNPTSRAKALDAGDALREHVTATGHGAVL